MRKSKILLITISAGLLLAAVSILVLFGGLPATDSLITRSSPDATKILDRKGRLLYEILDPRAGRRTRVSLAELPLSFRQAVIAVEDANFYENPGVDLAGIARAAFQNLRAGQIVAGGSTITQQLAREILLSKEERQKRSFLRKTREALLALRITETYSKDQILESYLNEVYFGNLAYGAEAAARVYFGKPVRDLDLSESALLAGLIQSPAAYDPFVDLDAARARQRIVLGLMVKNTFISNDDMELAANEALHLQPISSATTIHAPHFVAYVRDLLESEYGAESVNRGGLEVVTSLDLDLQERAEAIIRKQMEEMDRQAKEGNEPDHNVHDAALVALDPTSGEILAMVGSADYFNEKIDGAVNVALANRQPGSAIKPITYATAFSTDYSPATVLSDVPTSFQTKEGLPYEPQNYDRISHGPISLRQALATSNNMVAVKVLDHVGLDAMIATARALGISTFTDSGRFGLALTLGGGEVKLLDLTAAYAAFDNGGRSVDPVGILSVDGAKSAFEREPGPQVVSPQVAYLITSVLSDDSARIGAFGEDSILQLDRPAAAKTGTTTDFKDNWTVGYTPDLVVGVWVGNADNEPMYKITGITGAGPIWHDLMQEALKTSPVREFVRPDGLVDVEVCDTSGLLPTAECARRRVETFVVGKQPTQYDKSYRSVALDAATGLEWAQGCVGPKVDRTFRILPADAIEWGIKQGIPQPPALNCKGIAADVNRASGTELELTPALVITSPAQNSTFAPSSQLPVDQQQIEIAARPGSTTLLDQVTLVVDGKAIGAFTRPPYRAFWVLASGEHTVQAIGLDSQGMPVSSAAVRFAVESDK